jgi:hypothetical protein
MPVTSTSGDTGNGATLTFSSTSFAVGLQNIQGWTEEIERLEVSTLASTGFKKYIVSDLIEAPEITVNFYWDTSLAKPTIGGTSETITITFPLRTNGGEATAANYAGSGFIRSITWPTLENGSVQMGSMVLSFNGVTGPTWTKSA